MIISAAKPSFAVWISVALGLWLTALPHSFAQGQPPVRSIGIVYWGSADCKWCTYWESSLSGMEAEFRSSDTFKYITYTAVKNAHLNAPYVEGDFKNDGRWIWKLVSDGTFRPPRVRPAWSIFLGQKHVASYFGTKAWKDTAFPNIAKLVHANGETSEALDQVLTEISPGRVAGPAQVSAIDLVPYLNRSGKDAYREWLKRTPPRAFAVGIDGAWGRGKSASEALAYCERYSSEKCETYAVDQEVVWSGAAK